MAGQGNNVAATIWGCTIFHCSLIQQPKETLSWKHFSFNLSSFFDLNKLGKNKQLSLLQKLPYGSLVDHVTLTVFKFHNLAVYNANICINKESCWNWCLDTQVLNIFFFFRMRTPLTRRSGEPRLHELLVRVTSGPWIHYALQWKEWKSFLLDQSTWPVHLGCLWPVTMFLILCTPPSVEMCFFFVRQHF